MWRVAKSFIFIPFKFVDVMLIIFVNRFVCKSTEFSKKIGRVYPYDDN